jgi:hypothetical protein
VLLLLLLLLRGSVSFCRSVRLVIIAPVEILNGWRRGLLLFTAASLLLLLMMMFSATISVPFRLLKSPDSDLAGPGRAGL